MTTTIGGIGGDITLAGYNAKFSAWEADLIGPNADITAFDSNDWIECAPHGVTSINAKVFGTALSAAGTTIQGSGGGFSANGYVMKFDTWTANIGVTTADTTGFSDGGFRVVEPMLGTVYGTASGTCIEEDTPMDAGALTDPITPASFLASTTLTVNPGITFTGTALITNVRITRTITGKMVGTISYLFTGRVTPTWANTPAVPVAMMASQFTPGNAKADVTLTVDDLSSISFPGVVYNTQIMRTENGKCDVVYDIASRGAITWNW